MEVTPKADKVKSVYSTPAHSASTETSPCESRQGKSHQKLSVSLRERLKRTRRSFTSPLSVAKRLCVDEEEDEGQVSAHTKKETVDNLPVIVHSVDMNRNIVRPGPSTEPNHPPLQDTQRDQLRREVKAKMETLRRLKMVKMYRSKNDLTQLQTLINKWRGCAQSALYELQSQVPIEGRKASLSELIDLFGLDDGILHFDRSEDEFTT
ncbi:swi5-dependent recombination DNA repair protein 1 homolog [Sphaeramia orbicularis]|uniref:Swi5-dependent recombination DNA repair protein 1 homolog n=1 Tax=Sphaeramia orbicularis TaxID=375764 RepID=A0A673BA60_9TELE|nr:swi5-dependent recombination DNA repair protein 1 homolog [Sphaeramia orbicularis]